MTTLCALSYPPFSTSSFLDARLRAGVCRIRLMADRLPSKQYVPVRFWYLAPKAVWHHRGQMVQILPGSVPLCRTAKATPTIRGGRSRLPSGHDLLVECQQHNQKKAQWIKRRAAAEAKCHSDRLESAAYMRRRCPATGRSQRATGTFLEVLKQGRTATPYKRRQIKP